MLLLWLLLFWVVLRRVLAPVDIRLSEVEMASLVHTDWLVLDQAVFRVGELPTRWVHPFRLRFRAP